MGGGVPGPGLDGGVPHPADGGGYPGQGGVPWLGGYPGRGGTLAGGVPWPGGGVPRYLFTQENFLFFITFDPCP